MPEGAAGAGCKAIGYTEIRDGICRKCHIPFVEVDAKDGTEAFILQCPKCGGNTDTLLVAFNSENADDYWESEYTKERVIYAMRHRRDKIPMYLRTGAKPLSLRIVGVEAKAKELKEINQKEAN